MPIHASSTEPIALERQAEQHHGEEGEHDAQHDRAEAAEQDRLLLLARRQRAAGERDDHRVVAREHDVDHHDLGQGDPEEARGEEIHAGSIRSSAYRRPSPG
jgi:hypothetical protein